VFKILPTLSIFAIISASVVQAQEYVAAGTELSVGEEATVPFLLPNGPEVPIALTVTDIEVGNIADLSNFDIPADLQEAQPYYVRFTYTNQGGDYRRQRTLHRLPKSSPSRFTRGRKS
jgi:hypothetical protein